MKLLGIAENQRNQILFIVTLIILTLAGSLGLLILQKRFTIIVAALCLDVAVVTVGHWLWNQRKQNDPNARFLAHCITQLKQTLTPEERQKILENMFALNILQGADLSGVDLSSVNLQDADMKGTDLSATKHIAADMSKANLKDANLSYANLRYVTLTSADMRRANLNGVTLDSSDLRGVKLQTANLRGASLRDADLSNSDLRHAILRHANLSNANLENANLSDADLNHCTLPDGSKWEPDTDLRQFTHPEHSLAWQDMRSIATWARGLFNYLKK